MNGKPRKTQTGTRQARHAKAARAHISEPRPDPRARRDPAQERSRQTVDAIVDAAGQLLVEHGRLGVTTNAVAERAGVSIGSLYQYFPNKETIFASLQERHRDQVMPLIQHALARLADPGLDVVDVIVGLMRAMADLHAMRLRACARFRKSCTKKYRTRRFSPSLKPRPKSSPRVSVARRTTFAPWPGSRA